MISIGVHPLLEIDFKDEIFHFCLTESEKKYSGIHEMELLKIRDLEFLHKILSESQINFSVRRFPNKRILTIEDDAFSLDINLVRDNIQEKVVLVTGEYETDSETIIIASVGKKNLNDPEIYISDPKIKLSAFNGIWKEKCKFIGSCMKAIRSMENYRIREILVNGQKNSGDVSSVDAAASWHIILVRNGDIAKILNQRKRKRD